MPQVGFGHVMLAVIVPGMIFACWSDFRRHRVPNWLNAGIAVAGLGTRAAYEGWSGLGAGGLGMLVGFGVLVLLWAMHAMGAGDVKFMAALGSWLGPQLTFSAVIVGGLAGGLIAAGLIVYRRCWFEASANVGVLLTKVGTIKTAFSEFGSAKSLSQATGVLPYAIPLSIGTGIVLMSNYFGWWEVL
ncbi:MAG: prepilin peptidase [Phycisphaerae bacterium]|nr:prepilin peptidase [Phycisphaerae bacterium]